MLIPRVTLVMVLVVLAVGVAVHLLLGGSWRLSLSWALMQRPSPVEPFGSHVEVAPLQWAEAHRMGTRKSPLELRDAGSAGASEIRDAFPVTSLFERDGQKVLRAVSLRDPIQRVLALFDGPNAASPEILEYAVNRTSFAQEMEPLLNAQTKLMAPDLLEEWDLPQDASRLTARQLRQLRDRIESFHFIGIFEHPGLSLQLFEKTLLPWRSITNLKVSYPPDQVLIRQQHQPTTKFSMEVYIALARYNAIDEIMYGIAVSVFLRRVALLGRCHPLWPAHCGGQVPARWPPPLEYDLDWAVFGTTVPNISHSNSTFAPFEKAREFRRCGHCGSDHLFFSYVHIHKNAGKTFNDLLVREFCDDVPEEEPMSCSGGYIEYPKDVDVIQEIQKGDNWLVVSEEKMDVNRFSGPHVLKGMMVRDPFHRAVSVFEYTFTRRKINISVEDALIHKVDHILANFANSQVRALVPPGIYSKSSLYEEDVVLEIVRRARQTLENMHFVGAVEHFRLSVCLWSRTLGSENSINEHCKEPFAALGSSINSHESFQHQHTFYPLKDVAYMAETNRADLAAYFAGRQILFERVNNFQQCTSLWCYGISPPTTIKNVTEEAAEVQTLVAPGTFVLRRFSQ